VHDVHGAVHGVIEIAEFIDEPEVERLLRRRVRAKIEDEVRR